MYGLQFLEILLVTEAPCSFKILISTSELLSASLYLSIKSNLLIIIYPASESQCLDSDACSNDCSNLHTDREELYSLAQGIQLLYFIFDIYK